MATLRSRTGWSGVVASSRGQQSHVAEGPGSVRARERGTGATAHPRVLERCLGLQRLPCPPPASEPGSRPGGEPSLWRLPRPGSLGAASQNGRSSVGFPLPRCVAAGPGPAPRAPLLQQTPISAGGFHGWCCLELSHSGFSAVGGRLSAPAGCFQNPGVCGQVSHSLVGVVKWPFLGPYVKMYASEARLRRKNF